jgi:hypothetical protein
MNLFRHTLAGACALAALCTPAFAKPIAFAHGTTVMAEYGAGTMTEAQVFYAPKYNWSFGLGHTEFEVLTGRSQEITYARANYLVKRWNLESAQANVFTWGGVGRSHASGTSGDETAWNAGGQIDYETRRVYGSLKTDYFGAAAFSHRIDTLQLGIAPYKHDVNVLATWFVVQARRSGGEIYDGTEWALLLRLFKRGAWVEAGATADGKLQAMAMINF